MLDEKIHSEDAQHVVETPRVIIRKCTVAEIEAQPNFIELQEEYMDECALEDLPRPSPRMETYKNIEGTGALTVFGAFIDNKLIGYATLLAYVSRHYDLELPLTETIFVAKSLRKTGAGIKLIHQVENLAASLGFPALLIIAPLGGSLAEILPYLGYKPTNMIFVKRLPHA